MLLGGQPAFSSRGLFSKSRENWARGRTQWWYISTYNYQKSMVYVCQCLCCFHAHSTELAVIRRRHWLAQKEASDADRWWASDVGWCCRVCLYANCSVFYFLIFLCVLQTIWAVCVRKLFPLQRFTKKAFHDYSHISTMIRSQPPQRCVKWQRNRNTSHQSGGKPQP